MFGEPVGQPPPGLGQCDGAFDLLVPHADLAQESGFAEQAGTAHVRLARAEERIDLVLAVAADAPHQPVLSQAR